MLNPKTLLAIIVMAFLFGSGILYSSHRSVLPVNLELFPKHFSAFEKICCLTIQLLPLPVSEKQQLNMKNLEIPHQKLEQNVGFRLNQFELDTQNFSLASSKQAIQTTDDKQSLSANENLQSSIELLNQARSKGVLDKSTQVRLDELAIHMDEISNMYLWEQVLADLEAGRYQLSQGEISAKNHLHISEDKLEKEK